MVALSSPEASANNGAVMYGRRKSDRPDFIERITDPDRYAEDLYTLLVGELSLCYHNTIRRVVLFDADSPEKRIAKQACRLGLELAKEIPMRVPIKSFVLGAILHDIGKKDANSEMIIRSADGKNLRNSHRPTDKDHLWLIRSVHTRKGPAMIETLNQTFPWLKHHRPFLDTVTGFHHCPIHELRTKVRCARLINAIGLLDVFDALTSVGPERSYKAQDNYHTPESAARELLKKAQEDRYDMQVTKIFIERVLGLKTW